MKDTVSINYFNTLGMAKKSYNMILALGQAKISLVMALLRKVILLIPLIFILPNFFADKAFAVFLADIVAAAVATIMFFRFFIKMLKSGKSVTNE